jgi:CRP-like cAMP-binding protein
MEIMMHSNTKPAGPEDETELQSLPLFAGMETELLHGLLASTRFVQHAKGAVFLEQNQPVTRFYLIMQGWCGAVKSNANGQESILQIYRRGDFLPEPGDGVPPTAHPCNLQALTDVRLAMLPPNLVHNALERSKDFAKALRAAAVRHSHQLRNHIEQLTLHSAEQRVGRFLLEMRLSSDEQGADIDLPFDKSLVASYLGIKPETLSRTLQHFKDSGFKIDRNHLRAPDHQALCKYCDTLAAQQCHRAATDECPDPVFSGTEKARI